MDSAFWDIDATLAAKGFELVAPPMTYRGTIKVHGKSVTVEIEVPDATFVKLPKIKLLDRGELQVVDVAHLGLADDICYVSQTGLPLDLYDPGGAILRVLREAERALEQSSAGNFLAEVQREMSPYWLGRSTSFAVPQRDEAVVEAAEYLRLEGDGPSRVVVAKGAWSNAGGGSRGGAVVLHFPQPLKFVAPYPAKTLADACRLISGQRLRPEGWHDAVLTAALSDQTVWLAASNAVLGWRAMLPPLFALAGTKGFRPDFRRRMLPGKLDQVQLRRLTGLRMDLPFIVQRNLTGGPTLIGKRIVLVGCGTIGSYLSRMLVQSGAGCGAALRLYDPDALSPGNLGRHFLDFSDIGASKVEALAKRLHAFHPDIQINAEARDATADWEALEQCDLIIDATGFHNTSERLNQLFQQSARSGDDLALLHAHVFGNGIAAQTLLNLKDEYCCYRCQRTKFDGDWRYSPLRDRKSPLREAAASCGDGAYIPFGVDAPVAAATLALRAALDWSSGRPGKRLRTTVVDHKAGREDIRWANPPKRGDCVACGAG